MFCPKCGKQNDDAATFCIVCGDPLPLPAQDISKHQAQAGGPANPDAYYKAVIGPKNLGYYLDHFTRFDNEGKAGATWNWPAFFVTFYWMLYRKMWLNAFLYFLLPYLFFALLGIVARVSNSSGLQFTMGYLFYLIAIFVLIPMYANALYYKQCRKKISTVIATPHDVQRQLGELSGKGGTSNIAIIIIFVFVFVAVIGILAAVAIPAYQDYTTRARMAQAAIIGKAAADSVDNFYSQHRMLPNSLEESGFATPLPHSVRELSLNSQNGTVTITMEGSVISGKSLMFVPALDASNQLNWTCMSVEIQDRYLPQQCRHGN